RSSSRCCNGPDVCSDFDQLIDGANRESKVLAEIAVELHRQTHHSLRSEARQRCTHLICSRAHVEKRIGASLVGNTLESRTSVRVLYPDGYARKNSTGTIADHTGDEPRACVDESAPTLCAQQKISGKRSL